MSKAEVAAAVLDQRVIAIVRAAGAEDARRAAVALLQAGRQAVEISLVTPGALDVIKDLAGTCPPGAHIGVGTVPRPEVARRGTGRGRVHRLPHP